MLHNMIDALSNKKIAYQQQSEFTVPNTRVMKNVLRNTTNVSYENCFISLPMNILRSYRDDKQKTDGLV